MDVWRGELAGIDVPDVAVREGGFGFFLDTVPADARECGGLQGGDARSQKLICDGNHFGVFGQNKGAEVFRYFQTVAEAKQSGGFFPGWPCGREEEAGDDLFFPVAGAPKEKGGFVIRGVVLGQRLQGEEAGSYLPAGVCAYLFHAVEAFPAL